MNGAQRKILKQSWPISRRCIDSCLARKRETTQNLSE